MINSMTGYGNGKGFSGKTEISIEIKSVNSRFLDCTFKMPRTLYALEESLKAVVSKYVARGKVDIYISLDSSNADDVEIRINRPLAEAYIKALNSLSMDYELNHRVCAVDLTRFPDVLVAEKAEADIGQLGTDISVILEQALVSFDEMRNREGARLSADISERLDGIEKLTESIIKISPVSVAEYRKKLELRMREVLEDTTIDESRILTEAALFADRVAIDEETVRLQSHANQIRIMLQSSEPIGRKLDFLVQELNREANTIGSKANDTEMSKLVIELKSEIEKIKEQAQNIE